MIVSKIKKHFSIFFTRLQEKRTLEKMISQNDGCLIDIVNAFMQLKSGEHPPEDILAFNRCEDYRKSLLNNESIISYDIFGPNKRMKINQICKQATSKTIWGQFIYLIAKTHKSPYFLEIGTNLGVSGSYILEAIKDKLDSKFITMEGVPQLCEISQHQFATISQNQKYKIIQGLYETTLAEVLNQNINFNILFIDGNHKKVATIKYFNNLKSKINLPAVFIFDDINWSYEMREAWSIIKSDSDISYSIDMFKLGLVILNKTTNRNVKEHFNLHLAY